MKQLYLLKSDPLTLELIRMSLRMILTTTLVALFVQPAIVNADNWAGALFETQKHHFGTVARSAKTEHLFEFVNTTDSVIRLSGVRTSCGCTTPTILTKVVAPGETGQILAHFNTHAFFGQRGANLTVTFSHPRRAEVHLRVDGYVRRDVVFNPSEINFGQVNEGQAAQVAVAIQYLGRSNWNINEVRSPNENVNLEVAEFKRGRGGVTYHITAKLDADALPGFINSEVVLLTNDRNHPNIALSMHGQVRQAVTVSPETILLSNSPSNQAIEKKLFIKSVAPVTIDRIECSDPRVSFEIPNETKKLQVISVRIAPNAEIQADSTLLSIYMKETGDQAKSVEIQFDNSTQNDRSSTVDP